jgi:hypothetical protein
MKHIIKIILLSTLFSQVVFSASCDLDKTQMDNQILKYKSISTAGCPLGGINQVYNVIEKDLGRCSATCVYTRRSRGPLGTKCNWKKGNWGDTLYCD